MEVTRTQYPVGQGCFHAGRVSWIREDSRSPDDFHYVYDCGSSDGSTTLHDAVVEWRRQTPRLDALFVSHLDTDHVNGIDRLLASVMVDTVYIPYVDAATHVLDIVEAEVEGALSASVIEARLAPGSWFGRRGVARIVRVRASRGGGSSGRKPEPFDDDAPDEEEASPIGLPPKAPFEAKARSQFFTGAIGQSVIETMDSGSMVIVNPGRRHLWALVPHVDPASNAKRRVFYREVRQVLSPDLAG